jgi:tight adherence protein B
MKRHLLGFAMLVVAMLLALPAVALQAEREEVVLVDVNLANYDENGQVTVVAEFRNIDEFDPEQMVISQDGVVIDGFEVLEIEDSSVQVGVVLAIDVSGSMEGEPLQAAKDAAIRFVNQKSEQDSIALVTFSDQVNFLVPFTDNARTVTARISELEAEGGTAFYDAVVRSAQLYAAAPDLQPHIIALTDGFDTASTATLEDAVAAVVDDEVRVFGIALESEEFAGDPIREISDASRGLYLATTDPAQLDSLYDQIRRELNNKVVLRFNATQFAPSDVDFAIQYENLRSNETVSVPGFVASDVVATIPEDRQLAAPEPYVITSNLPAPAGMLRAVAVIAAAAATLGVAWILFGPKEESQQDQLRRRLATFERGPEKEQRSGIFQIALLRSLSDRAESVARRRGLLHSVNAALEQANIALRPGEAIALALLGAVLLGGLVAAATGNFLLAALVLLFAFILVLATLNFLGRREKLKFEDQLPDTLTLLATSLRAGYSLLQAIEAVSAEAPLPTGREFGRAITEIRLGRPVVDALEGIAGRTQSEDFAWAVMAIEIQREVGGNLSEVLNTVADTMLQRNRLRREVKALTAEGRISAFVLSAMPFGLFAFLYVSNRSYLDPLLGSVIGLGALLGGLVFMGVGIYWMIRIVDIDI